MSADFLHSTARFGRIIFQKAPDDLETAADVEMNRALVESTRGDRAAFERIVKAHESMVFSMGYHSTGNAAEAEELAQDVFLELFRNLRSIETPAHLAYWLRKVTSRKCIDAARRARKRPKLALEDVPEPASSEQQPDTLLSEKLRRLVASLPEEQRQIVILRFQEELEPAEISEVLGMPVNSVKSALHRSLSLLREKLERSGRVVSL